MTGLDSSAVLLLGALALLLGVATLGVGVRKRQYQRNRSVRELTDQERAQLRQGGETARGLIEDVRVLFPLPERISLWQDLLILFGGVAQLEDTDGEPTAVYLCFRFDVEEGTEAGSHHGFEIWTGEPNLAVMEVGKEVQVRYLPEDPSVARLEDHSEQGSSG